MYKKTVYASTITKGVYLNVCLYFKMCCHLVRILCAPYSGGKFLPMGTPSSDLKKNHI
jgi:hypothetical protein